VKSIAAIIEDAVTEKLERLESKRYGKTKSPRKSLEKTDTSPASRYIPAPVRRPVYARDGGQCSFVDEGGRRCTERRHLEFHHIRPYGREAVTLLRMLSSYVEATICISPRGNTVRK
jgi:hypothetical protein